MAEKKYAIRFGLGAIKAVGLKAMESAVEKRKKEGDFENIFDFAKKMDAKSINKKSIEALAKAGAFDNIEKNRRQIFESYDVISAYAVQQENEANSNQMTFFGELIDEDKSKPDLKKVEDWDKIERLKKEFEAFGFFLNEHPLDDSVDDLKKRGVIFSDRTDMGEVGDAFIVKMAGVVASSKHRSGPRGRFAYLTISDHLGIYEAMIFDEALITRARDLLADGSSIMMEAMVRKDEGGTRILMREVQSLEDFLRTTTPRERSFEDIKQLPKRKNFDRNKNGGDNSQGSGGEKNGGNFNSQKKEWGNKGGSGFAKKQDKFQASQDYKEQQIQKLNAKQILPEVEIKIKKRDPIFDIKSFLSRRKAPEGFDKQTKVSINVDGVKIALPEKYILDQADCDKVKNISGVESVES